MLHPQFINRLPGRSFNPFVKTFMISDGLLFSAWSLIFPLFAVFVTTQISGGDIKAAASTVTTYFVVRIITEIFSGKYLSQFSEGRKLKVLMLGMVFVAVAYIGFAFSNSLTQIYLFWTIAGIGWGLATPTRLSLFSLHLDRDQAVTEWSTTDVINLSLIALSTAVGGFIATNYGFQVLFLLAAVINLLGIIPFYIYKKKLHE